MVISNLQQIISSYIDRFEELNNSVHQEYYKWQIAKKFKPMMEEALAAPNDEFPDRLDSVRKLTMNLIDSYTLPFRGLVEFAKKDPEAVKKMYKDLFLSAGEGVDRKTNALQEFLEKAIDFGTRSLTAVILITTIITRLPDTFSCMIRITIINIRQHIADPSRIV